VGLVACAACAYSYVAAGARPFTTAADVVTATAFAVLALVMGRSLVRRYRRTTSVRAAPHPQQSVLPWLVALGVLGAWELATYLAGFPQGRHAFPTLSSLSDIAFRWRAAKTACFAAWLAIGWGLVRR